MSLYLDLPFDATSTDIIQILQFDLWKYCECEITLKTREERLNPQLIITSLGNYGIPTDYIFLSTVRGCISSSTGSNFGLIYIKVPVK